MTEVLGTVIGFHARGFEIPWGLSQGVLCASNDSLLHSYNDVKDIVASYTTGTFLDVLGYREAWTEVLEEMDHWLAKGSPYPGWGEDLERCAMRCRVYS